MRIKHIAYYAVVAMLLLTTAGCHISNPTVRKQQQVADSLINDAYATKNYQRILTLADSLKEAGDISEGKAYY